MLHVITWVWGTKYPPAYVERLAAGVARNLEGRYRFLACPAHPADHHLTEIPGCFARLRTFDPAWQAANGIAPGDRIVCLDLDNVITGDLWPLVTFQRPFVILGGVNAVNPCPYNGSFWTLEAGQHADVFSDFSLEAAAKVPFYAFPDDQAWFAHKIPGAACVGPAFGVYGFQKPGWPGPADALPLNARLVAFFGKRDPDQFTHLPWVKQHWR